MSWTWGYRGRGKGRGRGRSRGAAASGADSADESPDENSELGTGAGATTADGNAGAHIFPVASVASKVSEALEGLCELLAVSLWQQRES